MADHQLTSQQYEALYLVATGRNVHGYLLKRTIPSLERRGLIVTVNTPAVARITAEVGKHGVNRHSFRLTPKGYEAFSTFRTNIHNDAIERLKADFSRDMAFARAKVQQEESEGSE